MYEFALLFTYICPYIYISLGPTNERTKDEETLRDFTGKPIRTM